MTWLDDAIAAEPAPAAMPRYALADPYNYGQDFACADDFTANMDEIAGLEMFAQDLVHRLITPRGSLVDDPNYGTDAREDISASLTQAELLARPGKYGAELAKDDRVDYVDITIDTLTQFAISLAILVTPLVGPSFRFTADITQAGALVTSVGSP